MRALTLAALPHEKDSLFTSIHTSISILLLCSCTTMARFFGFLSSWMPLAYQFLTQSFYVNLGDDLSSMCSSNLRILQTSIIWRFTLGLCWCLLHLFVSLVHAGSSLIHVLLCYIISSGLLGKYQNLNLSNLKYLAIVVDSTEAKDSERIKRLFHWLSSTGVKNVILYDMEGVLKKSMGSDQNSRNSKNTACFEGMTIELLSFSDNKEGVAKAASFLCCKYLESNPAVSDKVEPVFTEAEMANALTAVGCGGPDPDLILVYGPARCHLGFPAWRMRYTEIVHMGSLKTMRYAAIVKAIYDFSNKHQNYGT